ncbi:MAG: sulfatase, partial [Verrucomicrobiota bacterium]
MKLFPLLILLFGLAAARAAETRPNILWIIAEDLGPEALSSFGAPEAKTPVLDQFARDGMRYTRAYTTGPVCSVSRSAIITGMYATTIGAHQHRTENKVPLPAGVRPLPARLREAGYFTALVETFPARVGLRGANHLDWNFTTEGAPFEGRDWSELKAHQPFYAQVNFGETHRPYHAPAGADLAKVALPPYYPDHPVARQDWAKYLDSARELDRKVGRVLAQLTADGLAENTIVVFMADHGQSMVRGKQFLYEEGLHIPLIIRWPRSVPAPEGFQPGRDDPRLIEAIDLTASTLAW